MSLNLEVSKMCGLISYFYLPNFLFTKYKNVFHLKKYGYQESLSKNFINFAPEKRLVDLLIKINLYSQLFTFQLKLVLMIKKIM